MEQRIDWLDYAKGIGIVLVVYGHLLSSGFHAGLNINEHFFRLSDSIVNSFHMPFFFLLIGLLVPSSFNRRGSRNFLFDKFSKFAYPYLTWSFIQTSVQVYTGQSFRHYTINEILSILYLPLDQFWFLYALMWMFIAYAAFKHFGYYATSLLTVTACILYFYPIPTKVGALHSFSVEFLFFVSGCAVREYITNVEKLFVPLWITGILFVILVGSGLYIFEHLIQPTRLIYGEHPFYFLYFSALGIPACVGLSQYCSITKGLGFLKTLGTYSLQIYLVHMLAGVGARIVLLKVFHVQDAVLHIGIGVLSGLVVPIFIYKITIKYNLPNLFRFKSG